MTPKREHLIENVSKAEYMLRYWQDKPDSFWLTWKGQSKHEIIAGWRNAVSKARIALEKYDKVRTLYRSLDSGTYDKHGNVINWDNWRKLND
jgi:hypothetical protein